MADRRLADLLLALHRLRRHDRVREQAEAQLERADERLAHRHRQQRGVPQRRRHRLQRPRLPGRAAVQAVRVRVSLFVIKIFFNSMNNSSLNNRHNLSCF